MYYYVLQFLSAFLQPLHVWLIKGFGITPRHACLSDKNTAWLTAFRLYSLHLSVPCQSSPPGQWMACQQTLREWHSKGEQIKSDPLQTLRQMPFLSQPTQLTWVSGWHQSILVIYCNGLASSSTLNTTDMWCVKQRCCFTIKAVSPNWLVLCITADFQLNSTAEIIHSRPVNAFHVGLYFSNIQCHYGTLK